MPTYVLFVDKRKVPDIDGLTFGGPLDAFQKLGKYPTGSFESFTPSREHDPDFQKLEKDPNYRKVVVGGN